MIRIRLSANGERIPVTVNETDVLKDVLNANNVDYTTASVSHNGATLSGGDLNRTIAELNIQDDDFISQVVKLNNA